MSLPPSVSKLAEEFVTKEFVKPAVKGVIDDSPYGVIPRSSTTMALTGMLHHWSMDTYRNSSTVRIVLFNHRKAFDFVDHGIVLQKLYKLDIPRSIINWIIDFRVEATSEDEVST